MSKRSFSRRDQSKLWSLARHGKVKARLLSAGFLVLLPVIIIGVGLCTGFPRAWQEGKVAASNASKALFLPWEV